MQAKARLAPKVLQRGDFDLLLSEIRTRGYETVGPTVMDGAIVLGPVESAYDFPVGRSAELEPGKYRLTKRADEAMFGFVVGPTSAKKWLFPPRRTLFRAQAKEGQIEFGSAPELPPKTALIGLRACDLHAIAVQDKVFSQGPFADSYYKAVRERLLLIVVDCGEPASTCFCTSVGGSPAAERGYDLRMTELIDDRGHRFVLEPGSDLGAQIVAALPASEASEPEVEARDALKKRAEKAISKRLETEGLKELLYRNVEHQRWREVADRCLACGNCTMVCPTCFCSNVEEITELGSTEIRRDRIWDSCFNEEFSYIHGGNVRLSTTSRYRQWMTHKLAAWQDQFGEIGCVGCGRCITWCPVGIDITEEAAAIRGADLVAPRRD